MSFFNYVILGDWFLPPPQNCAVSYSCFSVPSFTSSPSPFLPSPQIAIHSVTHMAPGQTSTPILRSSLNNHHISNSGNQQQQQQQNQQPFPPPPPPIATNGTSNPFVDGSQHQVQDSGDDQLHNINLVSPPPIPTNSMKKAEFY